ncbi:hypothetical protein [Streptomyces yaizuensis]|uniref:Tautomerase family protein n=1 Tax=Streptomyces yaizuensis TaxID=2989713 RepID=A0ABQ5P3D8_9ACTN|nr:hypothetical protein [Streptomyces sp. YSPA8]GLF97027.1 tautomerase family protein [Streptomyces sp. YSPA8]
MPTITINCPPLPAPRRRAAALRITRWLGDHGVRTAHAVVRFEETAENTVFSGGMPLEALPHRGTGLRHASVICCVGVDREEGFRAGLAHCVADALGVDDDTSFFYLEFRPTPRTDVVLGAGGRLRRADGAELPRPV